MIVLVTGALSAGSAGTKTGEAEPGLESGQASFTELSANAFEVPPARGLFGVSRRHTDYSSMGQNLALLFPDTSCRVGLDFRAGIRNGLESRVGVRGMVPVRLPAGATEL